MAETSTAKTVNKLASGGDHDRVVMLSLSADGSPDQHNPEIIGDKDAAKAATAEQVAQQAVAALDAQKQAERVAAETSDTGDVLTNAAKDEADKAAADAEKRAASVVDSLHKG